MTKELHREMDTHVLIDPVLKAATVEKYQRENCLPASSRVVSYAIARACQMYLERS